MVPTIASPRTARRPVLVAGGAYAAFMALHVAVAWDSGRLVTGWLPGIGNWLGPLDWAIYSVVAAALATAWGWSRTGITRRPTRRWLVAAGVPVLAGAPFLVLGLNISARDVLPLLVVGVPLVAFNEEVVFRGVILDMLRPLGLRRAVLGSAILFGLAHLPNLLSGANPAFTAMQVAATVAGGVALAAIRIRSRSLWPVLLAHWAMDIIAVSTVTGPAVTSPLLIPTLLVWLVANLALWRFGWRLLAARVRGSDVNWPQASRAPASPPARRPAPSSNRTEPR